MDPSSNKIIDCSNILTGMSHEMRTHMNAIVALSFLMKDNACNNSEREELSNHIFSSCEQLMNLFDSFLHSANIDAGSSKAESKVCRIDKILEDIVAEFRDGFRKENDCDLNLCTDINSSGAVKVLIDREIIYRAIRSLFQISIKNTVLGYVKLGFTCKEEKLIFYVLDSGNGYAKYVEFFNSEDMNKSLSLFSDTYTAINIILLRKLVTILGGTIWIEHNEIEGAGIYFSIPAKYVSQTTNINTHSTILI